jgi:hypothetical protein
LTSARRRRCRCRLDRAVAVASPDELALLAAAEQGRPASDGAIAFQQALSSTKFSVSYIGLFLFGLAIPRTSRLGWTLMLFLTAGTLVTAVAGYAAPAGAHTQVELGRLVGFLAGFALVGAWLRRAPDGDRPPRPRTPPAQDRATSEVIE